MNDKLGVHVGSFAGLNKRFLSEQELISMMRSSIEWQEHNGPMVIIVDEPFYDMIFRMGLEELYQDIIPLYDEADENRKVPQTQLEAYVMAKSMLPPEVYFLELDQVVSEHIPNGGTLQDGKVLSLKSQWGEENFVDLQLELLPEFYKQLWLTTMFQELFMQKLLPPT